MRTVPLRRMLSRPAGEVPSEAGGVGEGFAGGGEMDGGGEGF